MKNQKVTDYDKVKVEDLARQIVNIGKKFRLLGVNNIAILSVLIEKNISINKIIKKVTEEIFSMCAENVFYFIYNDMIDISMICKDGLNLTTNNCLKYLKGFQGKIGFSVNSRYSMD